MAGNAGSLESLTVEVGELESALKDGLQARRRNHTPGHLLPLATDSFLQTQTRSVAPIACATTSRGTDQRHT